MKMSKITLLTTVFLASALFFTACNKNDSQTTTSDSINQETSTTGKIQYSFDSDSRKWKVVNKDTQEQMAITQYILADQNPETATELFTITEMTDVNITPANYFAQFITELQKRYSNTKIESKVINQKTDSLLGEWWVDGQSPDTTQHEWIRIIKKGNDIAILRYSTTNTENLNKSRNAWESILNNASFK